jgi:hypothetical protein
MPSLEEIREKLLAQQAKNDSGVETPRPPLPLETKKVEIDNVYDGSLTCPRCGCDNLHQTSVTAFWRSEDQSTVLECYSDLERKYYTSETDGENNPSSRRQGITIEFDCEQCEGNKPLELCITQHKGTTYLTWR